MVVLQNIISVTNSSYLGVVLRSGKLVILINTRGTAIRLSTLLFDKSLTDVILLTTIVYKSKLKN